MDSKVIEFCIKSEKFWILLSSQWKVRGFYFCLMCGFICNFIARGFVLDGRWKVQEKSEFFYPDEWQPLSIISILHVLCYLMYMFCKEQLKGCMEKGPKWLLDSLMWRDWSFELNFLCWVVELFFHIVIQDLILLVRMLLVILGQWLTLYQSVKNWKLLRGIYILPISKFSLKFLRAFIHAPSNFTPRICKVNSNPHRRNKLTFSPYNSITRNALFRRHKKLTCGKSRQPCACIEELYWGSSCLSNVTQFRLKTLYKYIVCIEEVFWGSPCLSNLMSTIYRCRLKKKRKKEKFPDSYIRDLACTPMNPIWQPLEFFFHPIFLFQSFAWNSHIHIHSILNKCGVKQSQQNRTIS